MRRPPPRRPSRLRATQRGAVAMITALFLLIVVGFAVLVSLDMSNSEVSDSTTQHNSIQALFLAESGVERVSHTLSAGGSGACTSAALGAGTAVSFGAGSFQVLATPAPTVVSGRCRFRVQGVVGTVARTVEADVLPGGSSALSNGTFNSNASGWILSAPTAGTTLAYDGTSGNPAGSLRANRGTAGGGPTFTATQTLATSITTSAANTVFTVNFDYLTDGNVQFSFQLLDSLDNVYNSGNNNNSGGWASAAAASITVPTSGTVVTRFRVTMRLTGGANNSRIDNVALSGGGGGGATMLMRWTGQ